MLIITSDYCCVMSFSSLAYVPSHYRSTKTHPGPVVHLSDSPKDEGKVSKQMKELPATPPGSPKEPNLMLLQSIETLLFPSLLPLGRSLPCFASVTYLSFSFLVSLLCLSF